MAVNNDITQANPVVDADFETWGQKQNTFFDQVRSTVGALVTQFNALQSQAASFLSRAGGAMTGDLTLISGQPSGVFSAGYRGAPVARSVNTNDTVLASDAGKTIRFFDTNSKTITLPNTQSAPFQIGTVIVLRSFGSGTVTIAPASGVEIRVPGNGTPAARSLLQWGHATLQMEDNNLWVFSGTGAL